MTYGALSLQVKARTKAAFGTSVYLHLFRDCVATAMAKGAPERAGDVALVLGHDSLATSERHYNHTTTLSASRTHQDIVEDIRQQAEGDRRKRGRTY